MSTTAGNTAFHHEAGTAIQCLSVSFENQQVSKL